MASTARTGNISPPHLAKQGVGIVCLHYGVEVPKGEAGDKFLDWIGGYFETDWSVNPHWTANFKELQGAVDAGRMHELDNKSVVKQALWGLAGELGLVKVPEGAQKGGRLLPPKPFSVKGNAAPANAVLSETWIEGVVGRPDARLIIPESCQLFTR